MPPCLTRPSTIPICSHLSIPTSPDPRSSAVVPLRHPEAALSYLYVAPGAALSYLYVTPGAALSYLYITVLDLGANAHVAVEVHLADEGGAVSAPHTRPHLYATGERGAVSRREGPGRHMHAMLFSKVSLYQT